MTKANAKRRVVVTGIGAVTPLGTTLEATWQGMLAGKVPARPVTRFDASQFPTKIAYEVADFTFDRELVTDHEFSFLNLAAQYGVTAAHEAIFQSGARNLDPDRVAVCLGVGMVSPEFDWYDKVFIPKDMEDESVKRHIRFFPDQLSAVVARMVTAKGGISTVHTACASSGQSLGEAYEMVAYGDADFVLTGGELGALIVVDAVARLIPGVLGNAESAQTESFESGLLEHPHYTRPPEFRGLPVPEVLQGGDHARIARWRRWHALQLTKARRPDLFAKLELSKADLKLLSKSESEI